MFYKHQDEIKMEKEILMEKFRHLFLIIATCFFGVMIANMDVYANTLDEVSTKKVTIWRDTSSEMLPKMIDEIFDDENVVEIDVIDPKLYLKKDLNIFYPISTTSYTRYEARGSKANGTSVGTTLIYAASGEPGMTLHISATKSVAKGYSCSYSISSKQISSVVGFSVTGTSSVTIGSDYTVPKTANGKKVSSVKISAYPLYQNYVYSVDKVTSNRGLTFRTKNVGTGTARKAVGYSFKRTFYY